MLLLLLLLLHHAFVHASFHLDLLALPRELLLLYLGSLAHGRARPDSELFGGRLLRPLLKWRGLGKDLLG